MVKSLIALDQTNKYDENYTFAKTFIFIQVIIYTYSIPAKVFARIVYISKFIQKQRWPRTAKQTMFYDK